MSGESRMRCVKSDIVHFRSLADLCRATNKRCMRRWKGYEIMILCVYFDIYAQ